VSGVIPALPLIVIRPFLPRVAGLAREEGSRHAQAASLGAIFAGDLRRTTIVTTIMFACSYGAAFGAIQQMPGIVPGLARWRRSARPAQEKDRELGAGFPGGRAGSWAACCSALLAAHVVARADAAARLPGARPRRGAARLRARRELERRRRSSGASSCAGC
jgi:hypothetical protein